MKPIKNLFHRIKKKEPDILVSENLSIMKEDIAEIDRLLRYYIARFNGDSKVARALLESSVTKEFQEVEGRQLSAAELLTIRLVCYENPKYRKTNSAMFNLVITNNCTIRHGLAPVFKRICYEVNRDARNGGRYKFTFDQMVSEDAVTVEKIHN